jgi:hypothetical protein
MSKMLRKGLDAATFVRQGGIRRREAAAARVATAKTIEAVRREWLPMLQGWLKGGELPPETEAAIAADVKRIRRALGLPMPVAHKRAMTRKRVAAYRERKRQSAEQIEPEGE